MPLNNPRHHDRAPHYGRRALRAHECAGLTLTELLVTLAAISFLAAIILPSIQAAREGARRTQCADRIRQIGVACAAHESANGAFPYTSTTFFDLGGVMRPPIAPHVSLLPYIELADTAGLVKPNDFAFDLPGAPPASFVNDAMLSYTVPVFVCPSDARKPGSNSYRACLGGGPGIFPAAICTSCSDPRNASGAFVNGRSVSAAEFLDGLSSTALFSEKIIGSRELTAFSPSSDSLISSTDLCTAESARSSCAQMIPAAGAIDSYGGSTWLYGGWRGTWYNHVLPPNSSVADCGAGQLSAGGGTGAYAARSRHPGGVQLLLADGALRFTSQDIDFGVWAALASRANGDVLDDF